MEIKYKLEEANSSNTELLIKYKLASILDYANNIEKEEMEQINNYVNNTIPKQINDYKLIKVNDKIVGCLLLEKFKDGILLNEIYLENDYRGKGIGSHIISKILANNSKVYLWVYKDNKRALSLYEKLGFKIKETTETRFFMEYAKE